MFTDIEGSTRLERAVGTATWATVVAEHERRLREAIESHGGSIVKTEGDAVFAAFADPAAALLAIAAGQRAIAAGGWAGGVELRVRAGLHLGEGRLRERRQAGDPDDYVGIDVNFAARVAAAANGGQVLLSHAFVAVVGADLARVVARAQATVIDEGLRVLKDFEEPTRLHRLVVPGAADDTRPLRTLDAPGNLPHETTSLVGREVDIERVAASLADGRIVTLTGPGGSGKTRLAIAVAAAVRSRFPHGTWFVDLAAVRDPALIETAVGAVLGVRESGQVASDEAVRAWLRDRQTLLVLDNMEQLLPGGADRVAALARAARDLRLLVTSRELLRISGERGHPVPTLDVEAGARLFEDRARAQRPDLDLTDPARATIREICQRLGGLPLAIELAAARVKLFSPALILEQLGRTFDLVGGARDVPERQRSLRATIAWSHDLLSAAEQRLFRRLGPFAGGWTIEDAARVVDPDDDLDLVLASGLESLADKSLVRIEPADDPDAGGVRFSLHPLIREYAHARLLASGEGPAIEARHAAVFAELAADVGGAILGPRGEWALKRLDREQHNLRAAADWSMRTGDPAIALGIVSATWRWYQQRGRLREARSLLAAALDGPVTLDPRLRIDGLAADGGLAYWMEDFDGARSRYEARLQLAEASGDSGLEADANYDMAFLYVVSGERERLLAHATKALDLYTAAGDATKVTLGRQALVLHDFLGGDYLAARDKERQTLAFFRQSGSKIQMADSLTLLSGILTKVGDGDEAWRHVTEGLGIFEQMDMASGLARSLAMASIVQLRFGDHEFGARLAGATRELGRVKGVMVAPARVLHLPDPAALAADVLGPARAAVLLDEGAAMPIEAVIAEVLSASLRQPDGP